MFFYLVKAVQLGTYCTRGYLGGQVFLCPHGQETEVGSAPNVQESPP